MEELQNELVRLENSKTNYNEEAEKIYRLRELNQNALAENAEREGGRQRIAEMTEFLNEQSYELEEYDEQLVIMGITVLFCGLLPSSLTACWFFIFACALLAEVVILIPYFVLSTERGLFFGISMAIIKLR